MTRRLIAELVLGLRNNMGAGAKQAARDLNAVDQAAKKLGATATKDAAALKLLADQMDRAGREARDFAAGMGATQKWGAGFDKQLARLKLTAQELQELKRSWQQLGLQIAASNDIAFRRNLVNRWKADSLGAIAAVRAARERLDAEDIAAMKNKAREEAKIARETARRKEKEAREAARDQARQLREEARQARELARQKIQEARRLAAEERAIAREQRRHIDRMSRGFGRQLMYTATGATGIYGGAMLARRGITSGAEATRETARQTYGGLDAAGQARISASAYGLSTQYPSMTPTKIREYGAGAYNFTGSVDKAIDFLPDLVRARVAIGVAKGTDAAEGEIEAILKSADIVGLQDEPGRFRTFLQGFVKASQVERNQISGQEYLSFFKRAKVSGQGFSDEFLSYVAPTLMQQYGGATAGTMASTAFQQMAGNRISKKALGAQTAAGLRDKEGTLKDRQLYITDPLAWADKHLRPMLEKRGVDMTSDAAMIDALQPIFSERNAAEFFTALVLQRQQLSRNREMYGAATGLEAADTAAQKDPFTAFSGVVGAWDRFTAALTGPAIEKALPVLNGIADGISSLAASLEASPDMAANLAYVATGFTAIAGGLVALRAAIVGVQAVMALAALGGAGAAVGAGAGAAAGAGVAAGAIGGLGLTAGAIAVAAPSVYAAWRARGTGDPMAVGQEILAERRRQMEEQQKKVSSFSPHAQGTREYEAANQRLEALKASVAQAEGELAALGEAAGAAAAQGVAAGISANAGAAISAAQGLNAGVSSALSGGWSAGSAPASPAPASAPTAAGRASGGNVVAGNAYRWQEHQGETFIAKQDGHIAKGGGSVVLSPTFTISGGDASEIVDEVMRRMEQLANQARRDVFGDYGLDPA